MKIKWKLIERWQTPFNLRPDGRLMSPTPQRFSDRQKTATYSVKKHTSLLRL